MHQLHTSEDQNGYHRLSITAVDVSEGIAETNIGLFRSPRQATQKLASLADEFTLCHKLLGLEPAPSGKNPKPCFRAQLNKCWGACQAKEEASSYNQRLSAALKDYQLKIWPYPGPILIKEQNPEDSDNQAIHLIDNWRYIAQLRDASELYEHDLQLATQTGSAAVENSFQPPRDDTHFDLDIYFILVRFLTDSKRLTMNNLRILPLAKVGDDHSY